MIKKSAQGIWVGCTAENEEVIESTSIVKAYVIHPVLWYWPLDLNVLFLGDKGVNYFIFDTITSSVYFS